MYVQACFLQWCLKRLIVVNKPGVYWEASVEYYRWDAVLSMRTRKVLLMWKDFHNTLSERPISKQYLQ